MKKILFEDISKSGLFDFIKENEERKIFNFLNANDIYNAKKHEIFYSCLCDENSINCIDGTAVSMKLSIFSGRIIPR
ncbi:MAG: hypothetical protein Q8N88_01530, partial [Nanoarchaeota archaeon]|nr:hypothetical protein [Nanoarchaeota archaeon]